MVKNADLSHRVRQFRVAGLPRQPPTIHKGTLFLVEDLVLEIERLEEEVDRLEKENGALRTQVRGPKNDR
jgi:hypothetical protein